MFLLCCIAIRLISLYGFTLAPCCIEKFSDFSTNVYRYVTQHCPQVKQIDVADRKSVV